MMESWRDIRLNWLSLCEDSKITKIQLYIMVDVIRFLTTRVVWGESVLQAIARQIKEWMRVHLSPHPIPLTTGVVLSLILVAASTRDSSNTCTV